MKWFTNFLCKRNIHKVEFVAAKIADGYGFVRKCEWCGVYLSDLQEEPSFKRMIISSKDAFKLWEKDKW